MPTSQPLSSLLTVQSTNLSGAAKAAGATVARPSASLNQRDNEHSATARAKNHSLSAEAKAPQSSRQTSQRAAASSDTRDADTHSFKNSMKVADDEIKPKSFSGQNLHKGSIKQKANELADARADRKDNDTNDSVDSIYDAAQFAGVRPSSLSSSNFGVAADRHWSLLSQLSGIEADSLSPNLDAGNISISLTDTIDVTAPILAGNSVDSVAALSNVLQSDTNSLLFSPGVESDAESANEQADSVIFDGANEVLEMNAASFIEEAINSIGDSTKSLVNDLSLNNDADKNSLLDETESTTIATDLSAALALVLPASDLSAPGSTVKNADESLIGKSLGQQMTIPADAKIDSSIQVPANPLAKDGPAGLLTATGISDLTLDPNGKLLKATPKIEFLASQHLPVIDATPSTSVKEPSPFQQALLASGASGANPSEFTAEGRLSVPMTVAFGQAHFSNSLAERTAWMVGKSIQTAEIQLDPPELGALHVKIHLHQDQASVSFVSANPQVRDAVEQSMGKLRELLQDQGLELVDSGVADQRSGQRQEPGVFQGSGDSGDRDTQTLQSEMDLHTVVTALPWGIDYYA